jgi:DNA-binding transcriptional MerR regulator
MEENLKPQETDASGKGLLRVSDLAKAAGVSLATIHYYLREGLLAPVKKTARNMAYYSPQSVDDIRFIKELQVKRYLPLSAIKLVLKARREGQNIDHVDEMRSFLDDIYHPASPEAGPKELTFSELVAASGLPVTPLTRLEALGLLMPAIEGQHKKYDDLDLCIAKTVKELGDFGLSSWDLRVYYEYVMAIRNEAKTIHDKLHSSGLTKTADIGKLMNLLNTLKACLTTKIYRQAALEFH